MGTLRLSLLFVLVICCSSMAIAQDAKLVKKAEWGSGIYENIIEISDHYYIETSSHQIDVINPSLTGQESLVGQITLTGESQLNIVSIGSFKDHLVVATETKLSIYSILNTTELTLMFSTSINAIRSNAIEVDNNRLYYVDSNNDIFIVQETGGKFALLDTIHSKRNDENLYTYGQYLAINGSELLYLSHQSISGTLSVTFEKYNTSDFSLSDTATLSNRSVHSAIYVGDGRFVIFESGDVSFSLISSSGGSINILNTFDDVDDVDDVDDIGAVELAFQNKQLKALSWSRSLYSFEITDDNNVTLLATEGLSSYLSDASALNSFSVLNNKFIGLSTQDGLFEITFENGNFVDVKFAYNQSGSMGSAIVKDDLLYSPRGMRIDVMDIAELNNIKFDRQVMIPAGNIQRNGDTFIISNSNTLSNYSLSDNFDFNSSVDVTRPPRTVSAGEYLYTIVENDSYKLHRYNNDNALALYDTPTIIEFQNIEHICPNHLEVVKNKLLAFDFCSDKQIHLFNGIDDETFDYAKLIKHDFSYSNVAVTAEYIYFIDNSGITTVRLKDTDELEEVSSLNVDFEFGLNMQSAEVIDDYLLIHHTNELYLFSLTTPSTPVFISKTMMPNRKVQESSIYLEGGYILVTNTYEGQISFFEINKAPTANINSVALNEDESSIPEVIFTDPEDDKLTFTIVENALNGSSTVDELGLIYIPKQNFYGQDSITVMAEDKHGNSSEQELVITVNAVDDIPIVVNISETVAHNGSVSGAFPTTDVDGEILTYSVISDAKNGALTLSANGAYKYTANTDFSGADLVTYEVADGNNNAVQGTISFTVQVKPEEDSSGGSINYLVLLMLLSLNSFRRLRVHFGD